MSDRNDFSNKKSKNKLNGKPKQKIPPSTRNASRELGDLPRRRTPERSNIKPNERQPNTRPATRPPSKQTRPQTKRPRKSGKHVNSTFSKAIILLFFVFFVYGIGTFLSLFNNDSVESMVLKSIDITKNDTYKGIIIRDETLYKSDSPGYLSITAKELEKVSKGSLLFSISKENSSNLEEELSKVEDELFNLQTFREEYSNYRSEIDQIQTGIEKNIDNYAYSSYADISEITDSINNSLEIRKQIIFADQRISDTVAVDNKEIIENKIDNSSNKTYSIDGGIVSYQFDGLEETITVEEMKNLTLEQTKMDSNFDQHDEVITAQGDNILRVVETNIWYIGTYINEKEAVSLNVGDNKTLFINIDGEFSEIPARVNYISESVDKNVYVIFELRSYMQEFIGKRSIDVALKSLTYMNMKVPTTAIVYKEYLKIPISYARETNQLVVIKKSDGGTPISVPITTSGTDESNVYYLVDKSTNDLLVGSVLVNPDNAEETFLIPEIVKTPGVYKINNGIATFEKVQINEDLDESYDTFEFVYILPSSTLKEYDRILVYSNKAIEGEIIQ